MSNSIIYVVVGFGGMYDDSWESNLVATMDKGVAEKYIADEPARKELWKKHGNKFHEMIEGWNNSYSKKNPEPSWGDRKNNSLFEEWYKLRESLYKAYEKRIADSFSLDLSIDYYKNEDDISLRIEEVNLI